MKTDQDIFNRVKEKSVEFQKIAEVTLLGHSLFDMWEETQEGTPSLKGKTVANLGISGVTARQYLTVVLKQRLVKHLGHHIFIFLGVNDIVKEPDYSPQKVLEWLSDILVECRKIAPDVHYYLLEATPVNNIGTVENGEILALNAYLKQNCPNHLQFIPTWDQFKNEQNALDLALCHDGLHFTQAGYDKLHAILEAHL